MKQGKGREIINEKEFLGPGMIEKRAKAISNF
jgi:hypothetical protein